MRGIYGISRERRASYLHEETRVNCDDYRLGGFKNWEDQSTPALAITREASTTLLHRDLEE